MKLFVFASPQRVLALSVIHSPVDDIGQLRLARGMFHSFNRLTDTGPKFRSHIVSSHAVNCRIASQGCTCFSDKTDVWAAMRARMRAARDARIAVVREKNAAM